MITTILLTILVAHLLVALLIYAVMTRFERDEYGIWFSCLCWPVLLWLVLDFFSGSKWKNK